MKTEELKDLVIKYYLNDNAYNAIPEYVVIVEKLHKLLTGGKVYVKNYIDKIIILGWDAIVLLVKLLNSGKELIDELLELEEYELCARLRDFNETIKSYLYDFES